jgi:transcriptional regulator with XRE-family HTH domain
MKYRGGVEPVDRKIGAQLRLRREALGLTRRELAVRLDVSPQQLAKYETGLDRIATSRLLAACEALGLSMAELVEEAAGAPPAPVEGRRLWMLGKAAASLPPALQRALVAFVGALAREVAR